jgi:hypothetical protein
MRKVTLGAILFIALVAASIASAQGMVGGSQERAGTAKSMIGPSGTTPVGLMVVWLS